MRRLRTYLTFIIIFLAISASVPAGAQILSVPDQKEFVDSLKKEFDYGPYFGLYKDNYFTAGTSIGPKPTATNSDVKFQISIGIRLTNATLPWHTYLSLMYTQRTFWNVFQRSMPMRDMNFNPAIGWTKPFFSKGRFVGKMTLMIEHESNGRDGKESRSWNRISLAASSIINQYLMVHGKVWIPIVDGQNNRDLLKYSGLWQWGFVASTADKKFTGGITIVKRKGWDFNFNTIAELSWRVHEKTNLNLFAQYYNGYGENLMDYNKFHSRLRLGIVFKPVFFSEF